MIAYVDTSALIKLVIDEPGSPTVAAIWDQADYVCAASIGYMEARAALASALRGGRLVVSTHRTARAGVEVLWDQVAAIEVSHALISDAADLAEEHGLRGYDAVHLAAALSVGADVLASSDRDLCRAAERSGLHVPGDTP